MFDKTKLRKFMPLFVVAILATIFVAQSFAATPEIKDGYYQLGTKEDLEWFRNQVNSGNGAINAKLTADIDLKGSEANQWTPIGNGEHKFSGTFDGQGFKISGIYINSTKESSEGPVVYEYFGLFGYIDSATIQQLKVAGQITACGHYGYLGGVCAYALKSKITKCANEVVINQKLHSSYVGGICGRAELSDIKECINSAVLTSGKGDVGGICGGITNGTCVLYCENSGKIITGSSEAGGICGRANAYDVDTTISTCINKGEIVCDGSVTNDGIRMGGIVGEVYAYGQKSMYVANCVNLANVTDKGTSTTYGHKIGGICGSTTCPGKGQIVIKNCVNGGEVSGKVGYCGGIFGYGLLYNENVLTIRNSVNVGKTVNAAGKTGGVLGCAKTDNETGTEGVINFEATGYLKGTADKATGEIIGSGVTGEAKIYEESAIPAVSAILPLLRTTKVGVTTVAVDIYPTAAYNKEIVKVATTVEDTSILTANSNQIIGVKEGSTKISCEVSGLPGQEKAGTLTGTVTVEKGEDPEPEPTPSSGGGGGGCNAGFGALALLMALPMIYRRKK